MRHHDPKPVDNRQPIPFDRLAASPAPGVRFTGGDQQLDAASVINPKFIRNRLEKRRLLGIEMGRRWNRPRS
jgi:hypothetical protein